MNNLSSTNKHTFAKSSIVHLSNYWNVLLRKDHSSGSITYFNSISYPHMNI